MWNQNLDRNISVLEGSSETERRTTGDTGTVSPIDRDSKKLLDATSCGPDSGYISGPQTEYISEELDGTHLHQDINVDSGLVEDCKDINGASNTTATNPNNTNTKDLNKENTNSSQMILDSGIDCNLPEWFCGMKIDGESTPLNNLSCDSKNPKKINTSASNKTNDEQQLKYPKLANDRPFWEICYLPDDDGDTHLHLAIIGEYVQVVIAIIRLAPVPAVLDICNDQGQTPMHLAVLTNQANIVRRLVVAGAKTMIRDGSGNTPLHLACIKRDRACVEALTAPITSDEIKEIYKYSRTPLQVKPHQLPVDLEQRNYDGEQCVHICAQKNDIDTLRHLVKLGADINAREGKSGYTPLHLACENGNKTLAKFLLNECSKLNIETYTYGQWTAYQLAAEQKHEDLMIALQSYGAKLLTPPTSDDENDYSDSYDEDEY